jgi:hypothetical protein
MFVARSRIVGTFDRPEWARSCFRGLRRGQLVRPASTIWVKPDKSVVEIAYAPADARAGIIRGLALGAGAGLVAAAAVGLLAIQLSGASMPLAWLLTAVGTITGAVLGATFARPLPHPAIALLEADEPPSLTVETTDDDDREWAANVMVRAHAHVVRGPTRLEDQRGPASLRPA